MKVAYRNPSRFMDICDSLFDDDSEPYPYLWISNSNLVPKAIKILTNIVPDEWPMRVFQL